MAEVRTADGTRIHYDDVGRGEPALLFIPGWCTGRDVFRYLVPRFAGRNRVLSVDLRGHGDSEPGPGDFDNATVLKDLLAVVEDSGARQVIPVSLSHAGWWALGLRRALGDRVPRLVLLDWIVTEPPPPFLDALKGLQSDRWLQTRDALFDMWLEGVDSEEIIRFAHEGMGSFDQRMWTRAGREIAAAYASEGSPLAALATLRSPVETLHLYAQPADPAYQEAQRAFAAGHPAFTAVKLPARSHFPLLEVPDRVVAGIDAFLTGAHRSGNPGSLSDSGAPAY